MFEIKFQVMKLSNTLYIGAANVGGIAIRGGTRATPIEAAQSLFAVLAGMSGNTDDAMIAVSMLMNNTDISTALSLGSGE